MQQKIRTFFAIFTVIVITMSFHYVGWLTPVELFIRKVIAPTSSMLYNWSVTIEDDTEHFMSVEDLQEAYTALKKAYLFSKIDHTKMTLLEEENESLRKQLLFITGRTVSTVGADVIGKQIDPVGSTLIINRGSRDGIQESNPVIVHDGILIGKIVRVEEDMAIVRLITDNQSRIAATLMNKDKSIGLVEGGFGLSVRMTSVPQHEIIAIGDTVITSGLEKEMPHGLIIGSVESVEKEVYEPFQRAIIGSPVGLEELTVVSVMTGTSL